MRKVLGAETHRDLLATICSILIVLQNSPSEFFGYSKILKLALFKNDLWSEALNNSL